MPDKRKSDEFRTPKQMARENLVSGVILIFFSRSARSRSFDEIQDFVKKKQIGLEKRRIPHSKSTLYQHLERLTKQGFIRKNNRSNYVLKYPQKENRQRNIFHAIYNLITWEIVQNTPWLRRYVTHLWPSQITLQEILTHQLKLLTKILEKHYHNDADLIKKVKFEIHKKEGWDSPILFDVYAPPIGKFEEKFERKARKLREEQLRDAELHG